jgi:hypothetical protein
MIMQGKRLKIMQKTVVNDILSNKTGKVWTGRTAIATKGVMTSNVPQYLLASLFEDIIHATNLMAGKKGAYLDTVLDQLGANKK